MAENLAQTIREEEAKAQGIIAEAKAKAAEIVASAQTEAEQSAKTTRQQCHRQLREAVANTEKEAEVKAAEILEKGQADAKSFYEAQKGAAEEVASWLVREVVGTYGSCRNA